LKKQGFIYFLGLWVTIILLNACGQQEKRWKGTIEEIDNVIVVKNPKEPMYGENVFSLEEELAIGGSEGSEEYMLSIINSIAVDDEENIYVLVKMPFPARSIVDSNDDLIGYFMYVEEDEPITALLKYNSRQERMFKIAQLDPYSGKGLHKLPLQPSLLFDVTKDDNIVWANSLQYEINITSPNGILLKKIFKEFDPIEITEQDKKEIVPKILGRETLPPEEELKFAKYFDPINGISADDGDRIFIQTFGWENQI